jgi:hypothetical protein
MTCTINLKNGYTFWKLLFSGAWQKTLSRFSWEFPQTLLGVFYAHWILLLRRPLIYEFEGAIVLNYSARFIYGVALGPIIIGTFQPEKDSEFLAHEYGHTLQSKILGPFYLFIIGIPSLISVVFFSSGHSKRWFEQDATRRGKQKLNKKR